MWSRDISGGIYTRKLSWGSAIILSNQFIPEEPYRTALSRQLSLMGLRVRCLCGP